MPSERTPVRPRSRRRMYALPTLSGVMVSQTFDDLNIEINPLCTATRCINCGWIENAVVRANRFHRSVRTRVIPRRRVRKGGR